MLPRKIDNMRKDLAKAYPGKQWRYEVLYFMPDKQVIAIWHNLQKTGKLDRQKTKMIDNSYQISMWDLGMLERSVKNKNE